MHVVTCFHRFIASLLGFCSWGADGDGSTACRLRVSRASILPRRWPVGSPAKLGFESAKRALEAAGATDIYKTGIFAAHPGGTVKIGEIVDANLKTRIDNLYVRDCSVIPEAFGVPPTLTLVALGKRLARHLVAERQPVARVSAAPLEVAPAAAS